MAWWNDANAFINGNGLLTLGMNGRDAGASGALPVSAADATHKYALADVWVPVSPAEIVSTTLPALTLDGTANAFKRTLVAATHDLLIPFPSAYLRRLTGDLNIASPHGVKIVSLALAYRVNTSNLTSLALAIRQIDLTAQATVPVNTALTATTAGNTVTAAANQYLAITTVTTPAFISTLDTLPYGHATIVVPTNTADIFGASWRVSFALY